MAKRRLPRWLITVTPFSKLLALLLFITLPLITFYLGLQFGMSQNSLLFAQPVQQIQVTSVFSPQDNPKPIRHVPTVGTYK